MSSIGERLKEERQRLDMSQTEFGELGGVLKQAQIKYEKGERFPDAAFLAAISQAGADVQYIITGRYGDTSAAQDAAVDWNLLEQVIVGVEAFLSERKAKLRPDKKAGLIRVLYAKFSEDKSLNQARFKDFMEAVMATV